MDPVSIIVTALALGASNGLKAVVEESVKDLYSLIKGIIGAKYASVNDALALVEKNPDSQTRQTVLEEDLAKVGAADDADLVEKATQLIARANALMSKEAIAQVGVEIRDVEGGNLEIRRIHSQERGVVIASSKFHGDISVTDVNVSSSAEDDAKKK